VQLAVVAHIRHIYTDYDNLLKQVAWMKARSMVEQACLEKLAQWRGGEEEDPDAMEEILQEVIVIPDDDEAEDEMRTPSRLKDSQTANENGIRSEDDRHGHFMEETSISPTPSEDREGTNIGGGQYILNRPNRVFTERIRTHQEQAWKQAQDRVRDNRIHSGLRNPGNPTVALDYSRAQTNQLSQPFPGHYEVDSRRHEPRHFLSSAEHRAMQRAQLSPGNTYAGDHERSHHLHAEYGSHRHLNDSKTRRWEFINLEQPSVQRSPITLLTPEDPVPSVEPVTPRQARQLERADRGHDVIYIDYSKTEHSQPLQRVKSADGEPEHSPRIAPRVYQPTLDRERIWMPASPSRRELASQGNRAAVEWELSRHPSSNRPDKPPLRHSHASTSREAASRPFREPYPQRDTDKMLIDTPNRRVEDFARRDQPRADASSQVVLVPYPEQPLHATQGLGHPAASFGNHIRYNAEISRRHLSSEGQPPHMNPYGVAKSLGFYY
jgi:Uncharacterized conserved protein (DUF2293)